MVSDFRRLKSATPFGNSEILASLNKASVIESSWQDDLLEVMLAISPLQFERLAQRVLREAGFEEVRVTGKSGDGGIDGIGLIRPVILR
jgi:restriction system protein